MIANLRRLFLVEIVVLDRDGEERASEQSFSLQASWCRLVSTLRSGLASNRKEIGKHGVGPGIRQHNGEVHINDPDRGPGLLRPLY